MTTKEAIDWVRSLFPTLVYYLGDGITHEIWRDQQRKAEEVAMILDSQLKGIMFQSDKIELLHEEINRLRQTLQNISEVGYSDPRCVAMKEMAEEALKEPK